MFSPLELEPHSSVSLLFPWAEFRYPVPALSRSDSKGKALETLPVADSGTAAAPRARSSAATHTDGHQRATTAVTTATETATRDR